LPLAPLQEGLLFHALYGAHAPDVYTVQLVLTVEGALDDAALEAAAQALLARPASPRAGVRHEKLSRPGQGRGTPAAAPWRRIGLSSLEEAQRRQRLAHMLARERAERFDLAAPPLLRFALIRLAAAEHRLVLNNHHVVMDGWSAPVLVQEFLALYAQQG